MNRKTDGSIKGKRTRQGVLARRKNKERKSRPKAMPIRLIKLAQTCDPTRVRDILYKIQNGCQRQMVDTNWGERIKNMMSSKILLSGLLFSCILYITLTLLEHKYDWDIDQFMYFGSRLASREMAFVREFDDKSIGLHALFVIPYWLKSIRAWYIISIAAASMTAYFLYKTLVNQEKSKKALAAVSAMYFTFLITSTRGGINHINGIAACMTLACISGIALSAANNTRSDKKKAFPIYILLGAWSISIRPYYILTILAAITWPALRGLASNNNSTKIFQLKSEGELSKNVITDAIKGVALLTTFIVSINILPYILTGEAKALADGFIINRISIVPDSQQGIIDIFLIGTKKAPLVILPLIVSNIYVIADILKQVKDHSLNIPRLIEENIDIIYSGSIMPVSLALMISTRHFHNHYLALFVPFSAITLYFLLAKKGRKIANTAVLDPKNSGSRWRVAGKITLGLGVTYHCIYPIVKINEQFATYNTKRTQGRENIVKELKELRQIGGGSKSFVVTRDNHFNWRLNQSRLGIPHAALFSKIATGFQNIHEASNRASQIKTRFKYPKTSQLCETMIEANPDIYLVPKHSLEDNCLSKKDSGYGFYKEVKNGREWNLTDTEIGVIHIRNNQDKLRNW